METVLVVGLVALATGFLVWRSVATLRGGRSGGAGGGCGCGTPKAGCGASKPGSEARRGSARGPGDGATRLNRR